MQIKILQENLSKAVSVASRFVNVRAQLPVLANILLTAKKNSLQVSATNLEMSISLKIGAKVEKTGDITIPARTFSDIISNLKPGTVDLVVEKEQLKISSPNFRSTLVGMNSSDFPKIPSSVGKDALSIDVEDFTKSLTLVLPSVSVDETRPVLTGVLVGVGVKKMNLVSTDGFRLSQKMLGLQKSAALKVEKLIIPKNAFSELVRLSSDSKMVGMDYKKGDSQVVFGLGDVFLATRVIEGNFPDYEKIIPKRSSISVDLDREEFLRAVKLSSVFARDSANVVKLSLKKDLLILSSESSSAGSEEVKVDAKVKGLTSSGFEIAYNYRFLEDFLNVTKGEDIVIEFSDSNAPGVFKNPKDPDFLHLIMPVKLQG